jgi:hypothetical protein
MSECLCVFLFFGQHRETCPLGGNGRIEQQFAIANKNRARHLVVDRGDKAEGTCVEQKGSRIAFEAKVFDGDAAGLQTNVA